MGSVARHQDALSISLERRARARLEAGLPRAALEDLKRAERDAPGRVSVLLAKVRAHAMLGQRNEAIQALDAAARMDPNHPELSEARSHVPARASGDEGFGGGTED